MGLKITHLCELSQLIFVCMRQQRQQRHLRLFDYMCGLTMSNLVCIIKLTSTT